MRVRTIGWPRQGQVAVTAGLLFGLVALAGPAASQAQRPAEGATRRLSRDAVQAAMAEQAEIGYNLLASTNSTRFTTSVLLALLGAEMSDSPDGPPLLIHHSDWYEAYRAVMGLEPQDVPEFVALANQFGQDRIIEYRPSVIRVEVRQRAPPLAVAHVRVSWPDTAGSPDRYTFVDTTTSPILRITNRSRIRYWLLDLGNMVLQDEIEGIQARPLGGALGTLFSIVGDGNAVQNRWALAEDGLVVTYATAKKGPFTVRPLTVTYPDGTVVTEIPEDRDDLQRLASQLQQELRIEYPEPPRE